MTLKYVADDTGAEVECVFQPTEIVFNRGEKLITFRFDKIDDMVYSLDTISDSRYMTSYTKS